MTDIRSIRYKKKHPKTSSDRQIIALLQEIRSVNPLGRWQSFDRKRGNSSFCLRTVQCTNSPKTPI